ncbi:MAG: lipocalin-like domain-containing protein [Chloroflexi bacterium]|nr:lipocalin-like domain-containing protein [Chloroflexota bacterium]
MDKEQIVGTWNLISYELRLRDGIVIRPMGEGVQGILMYDAQGHVVVELMDPERRYFESGDWLKGTPEEIKEAFEGSLAYYGTYELEEHKGMILHHIQGCTFPNWSGTDQERIIELAGDKLKLITPMISLSGEELVGHLTFQRAQPGYK